LASERKREREEDKGIFSKRKKNFRAPKRTKNSPSAEQGVISVYKGRKERKKMVSGFVAWKVCASPIGHILRLAQYFFFSFEN